MLQREVEEGQAVLSTQVLQEFLVATTRKPAEPLSSEDGERAVRASEALPVALAACDSLRKPCPGFPATDRGSRCKLQK